MPTKTHLFATFLVLWSELQWVAKWKPIQAQVECGISLQVTKWRSLKSAALFDRTSRTCIRPTLAAYPSAPVSFWNRRTDWCYRRESYRWLYCERQAQRNQSHQRHWYQQHRQFLCDQIVQNIFHYPVVVEPCRTNVHTRGAVNQMQTRNMGQSPTWGRRRPMSDLKYMLGGCKVCKNLRGQHPLMAEI